MKRRRLSDDLPLQQQQPQQMQQMQQMQQQRMQMQQMQQQPPPGEHAGQRVSWSESIMGPPPLPEQSHGPHHAASQHVAMAPPSFHILPTAGAPPPMIDGLMGTALCGLPAGAMPPPPRPGTMRPPHPQASASEETVPQAMDLSSRPGSHATLMDTSSVGAAWAGGTAPPTGDLGWAIPSTPNAAAAGRAHIAVAPTEGHIQEHQAQLHYGSQSADSRNDVVMR